MSSGQSGERCGVIPLAPAEGDVRAHRLARAGRIKLSGTGTDGAQTAGLHDAVPCVRSTLECPDTMTHVAVIGAGITGVTTAYALTTRGYRVTSSTATATPRWRPLRQWRPALGSNAEVWNKLFDGDPGPALDARARRALLMNPTPSWHKLSWMAEFVREIPRYRANTVETVRLAIQAREALFGMARAEGNRIRPQDPGHPAFFGTRRPSGSRAVNALLRRGRPGAARRDPGRDPGHRADAGGGTITGGSSTPSDATGDIPSSPAASPRPAPPGAYASCTDAAVEAIEPGGGAAKYVAGARAPGAGAGGGRRRSGDLRRHREPPLRGDARGRVIVYPVKGYSITVNLHTAQAGGGPEVSILDEATKIVTSRLGDDPLPGRPAPPSSTASTATSPRRIQPLVD